MTYHVKYQRLSFDWDVADGTYTPRQLQKARLRVLPWGGVRTYSITPEGYAGDLPLEYTRYLPNKPL